MREIQQRRFNILDRTQEKIRIQTQIQEDDQFLALLATTASGNQASNAYVSEATLGMSKAFLNKLSAKILDHDLPCYAFLMRFSSFKDLRTLGTTDFDPVTMREILETGLYGSIWGIDLVVSRRVTAGGMYALGEPRFFGVLPIRTEMMLMPDDDPKQATIGYVGYEEIGMSVVVANSVAYGTHNVL